MATAISHSAVVLVLLLSVVRAQSSSASSSSSSAWEVSVVTNATDSCSQDEFSNDCWYPVTCKTCLSRAGCAVEVSTGRCVSSSSSSSVSSEFSSVQYLLRGEVEYCSASDPACFACRRVNAPELCLGSSNCVCVSQCEQISTRSTKCMPGDGMSYGSLIAAAAVLFPLLTYLLFKGSPCSASCSLRELLRRRRRAKTPRNLPAGLKLDAWRNHLTERADPVDEQLTDLELRSCFVPMESSRSQPAGGNSRAETGERVHVEEETDGDVSRAVAATDLPFSPTADRRSAVAPGREEALGAELV